MELMNNQNIPLEALKRAAAQNGQRASAQKGQAQGMGMGDFFEPFTDAVRPATSAPHPMGPSDFPVALAPMSPPQTLMDWAAKIFGVLTQIKDQLVMQNTASRPVIRSRSVDGTGQTLDWTPVGIMDRLMIRNLGPDPCWFSFDMNGPAVNAFTGDQSFELQMNESVNLTHCQFQKIGVKCQGGGDTATVHAIGFHSVAGNQMDSII